MSKTTYNNQSSTPSTPGTGKVSVFTDSTTKRLASVDESGTRTDYGSSSGTGIRYQFGGKAGSAGLYFKVSGDPDVSGLKITLDQDNEAPILSTGTLTVMGWNTRLGDATTIFKVLVNGIVQATVTLSGARGVDTSVSIPVTAGDFIAIEYDAGTVPQETTVSLLGT